VKWIGTVLALALCAGVAVSQFLAPIGPLLDRSYAQMTRSDEVIAWVYFKDKGVAAQQKLNVSPDTYLSQRAIARRARALGTAQIIDMQDVPVDPSYAAGVGRLARKMRHEIKWFNAVSVVATKAQLEQIRALPFVSMVDAVARYRSSGAIENTGRPVPVQSGQSDIPTLYNYGSSLTQNQQINTVTAHNNGVTGAGVLVGVLDAGFPDLAHPALSTRPILARYDFVANSPILGTNSTHGQETFSTIGGYAEGNLIGPAFGASFVLAVTEDVNSETPIEEDNWARGIIWADSIGIDVSSTSLGYNTMDSPWPSYTWQDMNGVNPVITRAADRAAALGIVVVNSAGNDGDNSSHNTLGAPADGFNVITAGAVSSSGSRVSFSSVGPTADGRIKPDIMAMGSGVTVAYGSSSYSTADGTSFSCPLSAGVAALVLSGNPTFNLTPYQVREAMRQTASRSTNPDRLMGWGILNAWNAINYPWIEHAALQSTEDTTARTVLVRIKSRAALTADSARVYYGIGGSFTSSVPLVSTGNPNEYSAQIPYLGSGVNATYYITARNSLVATRSPLTGSYSYQVGADVSGPTIVHRNLGNQTLISWPARIAVSATDMSGVDTVRILTWKNGVAQPTVILPLVGTSYTDTFHIARAQVSAGDSISYKIEAVDHARLHNVSSYPASGTVSFRLVDLYNLNEMFDATSGGFTGNNDWQVGAPGGTSPRPHSGMRCWGTILAGNYTQGPRLSSLTTPYYRIFSNWATFSFWHWYEIQGRFDGGNVKVSVNGGPFVTIQPVDGYPVSAIYTGYGNPLAGQPGYANTSGTAWSKASFDLHGLASEGDSVAVRFDFGADNSLQYRGWYIDDFSGDGLSGPPPITTAALGVDHDTVNVGNVAIGSTDSTKSILVQNLGQTQLVVTNILSSNPAFGVNRASFALNYLDTLRVKVYFTAPTPGGLRSGALTFVSNSVPTPLPVQVYGRSIGQAGIQAAPDSFFFARLPGTDTTRAYFTVRNPGTDTLYFRIDEAASASVAAQLRSVTQQNSVRAPKGSESGERGDAPTGSGGPDAFGYRWIDSDEPGGPVFNWFDISSIGTQITSWSGSADDGYATVTLPFAFPFYGGSITNSINVCTNGFISSNSTTTAYSNTAIPDVEDPNGALYAFWEDLTLSSQGSVRTYYDAPGSRFIIQWTGVPRYSGSSDSLTFQIVLQSSGSILYQYLRMASTTLNSATIGVENATGSIALQVSYNQSYVHNGLAILISNDILPWASVYPTSGLLGPGDSASVELRIHPAGLIAGRLYNGKMTVSGNSPTSQTIRIGLSTSTTDVPVEKGIPSTFSLGQNYPNPFNPVTTITYALPKPIHVQLTVYDVLGREVQALVNGMETAGFKSVRFDGSRFASGFYFYRIQAGDFVQTRKLLLVK
jgi:serine protease AprX